LARPVHRDPKTGPVWATFIFSISLFNRIYTPLQSEMTSAHIWNKAYRLTLTALPHYL